MADTQQLIRELFDAASDMPASQQRAWVEANAHGNLEAVASVMRLLGASVASSKGFMDQPAFKRQATALEIGEMIGSYRVLRELGAGGMGFVYLAVRSDEIYRRLVAIKVMRPELQGDQLKNRFLREREILASLDHPNIARIIDGGSTMAGLPYFVMDYVEGQPLDEYCRSQHFTLDQRLGLARQTCEAVQYLHDNNVLHRDLKPGNILVTAAGQVKLLDFGVSKLGFARSQFDQSYMTTIGAPAMTAGYASPEQITAKVVTAASDIYSLGVVFYELLTGVRPLDVDNKGLAQIVDIIVGETPVPPSSRRQLPAEVDPDGMLAAMRPRLAGDLDSILLMALRKEPERRYDTANAFADELTRFQAGRPVAARGRGVTYIAGKAFRRNPMRVVGLTLIAISIACFAVALVRTLDYRGRVRALSQELEAARNHQAEYASLPPAAIQSILRNDLNHFSAEMEARTPAILKSDLVPQEMTHNLAQQSLIYLGGMRTRAQDDPATLAALGRAYIAVAGMQWSPTQASLNDPSDAARTCLDAIDILNANKDAAQNGEVQATVARLRAELKANPAAPKL